MTKSTGPTGEQARGRSGPRRRAFGPGSARRWLLLIGLSATGAGCNILLGNEEPGTDGGIGGADGTGGSGSGGLGASSSGGTIGASGSGTGGLGGTDGSGGADGTGGSGPVPSTIGSVGEACVPNGAFACAGYDQRLQLRCEAGEWAIFGSCSSSERCDTREGNGGLCEPIAEECADAEPGEGVACLDGLPQVCGADRVSVEDGPACEGETGCVNGACVPLPLECDDADVGDVVCRANGTETMECVWGPYESEDCDSTCGAGVCVEPPSCAGLADTCGPSGDEDCCRSSLVDGGEFYRGADMAFPATVSDFRLDKYEVTVGRFRKFAAAWDVGWRPPGASGKHLHLNGGSGLEATAGGYEPGWDTAWATDVDTSDTARDYPGGTNTTWTTAAGANELLPINHVNWYESYAFCIWDGGFLPSEAEWQYAAAGGGEERMYPWGEAALTESFAVYDCRGNGDAGSACSFADIVAVGSKPDGNGRYGQSDLAGSMWEPNLDWYVSPYSGACSDCAHFEAATNRGSRGGSWGSNPASLPATQRDYNLPQFRSGGGGVRCARAP
jgi:sulfatase modifying factor 1